MRYFLIPFLLVFVLFSCNSPKEGTNKTPTIVSIGDSRIELDNGKVVEYFAGEKGDETVLFILRNSASMKNEFDQAVLNPEGEARSLKLAQLFDRVKLGGTMAGFSHTANETARPTADKKGFKVFNHDHIDYGAFLDYIYSLEKGKKYLVVGFSETIPDLLNLITAGKKFDAIPAGVYDDLFVVRTKSRGNASVYHLKMNLKD